MSIGTIISVEDYLRQPGKYEPDADYVDGTVEERPMGEDDHSAWQDAISAWFREHAASWNIRVRPELRVQITPTRFRVPDVAILDGAAPRERIAITPPLAVFEVLSPEDTVRRVRARLQDFAEKGVAAIFLVDPETGVFEQFRDGELVRQTVFSLPERSIMFELSEIAKLVN